MTRQSINISAEINPIPSGREWRDGRRARALDVTIRNNADRNPGALWSSVLAVGGEILDIEIIRSQQDIEPSRVSCVWDFSTPRVPGCLRRAWLLRHPDGLGRGERSCVRVWIAGWDAVELVAYPNLHVGVDYLGAPCPADYALDRGAVPPDARFALTA